MKKLVTAVVTSSLLASGLVIAKSQDHNKSNKDNKKAQQQSSIAIKEGDLKLLNPNSKEDHPVHVKYYKQVRSDPDNRLKVHDTRWRGKKWEYLLEYPRDENAIDPQRFEEILDTAGRHGWELSNVTHENHFYSFIFKRELHPRNMADVEQRLKDYKHERAKKMAVKQHKIDQANQDRMKNLRELQKIEQSLKQEQDKVSATNELLHKELAMEKDIDKQINNLNRS